MAMELTSQTFTNNEVLPSRCAYDQENQSPQLTWSEIPDGTRSFVLICDDPDAPIGTWTHWIVYDIPADVTELTPGFDVGREVERGIKQGLNDFGKIGYGGPHPPPGPYHRYIFTLYALDTDSLNLPPGAKVNELRNKMEGHVLTQASITGRYKR